MKNSISLLCLVVFLFVQCSNSTENGQKEHESDSVLQENANENNTESSAEPTDLKESKPQFVFIFKEDDANPTTEIRVDWNGQTTVLKSVSGKAELISAEDFKSKSIPENAIAACGSWWAGSGDYFYMIGSDKGLEVYKGWQDEEADKNDYHWEKFKEILK